MRFKLGRHKTVISTEEDVSLQFTALEAEHDCYLRVKFNVLI